MTTSLLIDDVRVICACQRRPQATTPTLSRLAARAKGILHLALSLCLAITSLGFTRWTPIADRTARLTSFGALGVTEDAVTGSRTEPGSAEPAVTVEQLNAARRAYFQRNVPFGALIYREAIRNGLEPELVAAIVRAESNFHPRSVSDRNATGLMQLLPTTGRDLGVEDLTDPKTNVEAGTKHLRRLHEQYAGDLALTLAAYNAGEGAVRRYDGIPPFRETQEYVRRVSSFRRTFRQAVAHHAARAGASEGDRAQQ